MSAFKFRAELLGHTSDVRGLCCPRDGLLVSASRDMTVRSWKIESSLCNLSEGKTYAKHDKYVTTVAFMKPNDVFATGLILTGCNDGLIRAFVEDETDQIFSLHGHTDTVCALDSNSDGVILSGSWDSSARFWNYDACIGKISRPGATIWSVLFLPQLKSHADEYRVATASSDSAIAIWRIPIAALNPGSRVAEFVNPDMLLRGHSDCVRSLALLDSTRIISASNDGSLRCWSLDSGTCLAEFYGHTNFVYSVAVAPSHEFVVSSSEDRTIRVWPVPQTGIKTSQHLECRQTISLPCQTAWCVVVTNDNDIAVGCSDSKIRLFSFDPKRQASEAALETYDAEVASSQLAEGSLGEINKKQLPGPEVLHIPGRSEGQVIVVREEKGIVCYQWSMADHQWNKVGDVVGSAEPSATGSNRTLFEGKEYDYVFTVDIQKGAPPIKLPFNKTEDPWLVAQQFLHKHNLPQDYLDTVAKYIISQAKLDAPGAVVGGGNGLADPFTGSGRYVPGGSSAVATTPRLFPSKDYVFLETINVSIVAAKLRQFNATAPEAIPDSLLTQVGEMSPTMPESDAVTLTYGLLKFVGSWPSELAFPLFDLLRCLVVWPRAAEAIFASHAWSQLLRTAGLSRLTDDPAAAPPPLTASELTCALFVFRLLANAVAADAAPERIATANKGLAATAAPNSPQPGPSSSSSSSAALAAPALSLPRVFAEVRRVVLRLVDESQLLGLMEKKKSHLVALATLVYNLASLAHEHSSAHSMLASAVPAIRGLSGLCIHMATRLLLFATATGSAGTAYPPEVPLRLLVALATALVTSVPEPSGADTSALRMRRLCLVGGAAAPTSKLAEASDAAGLDGWEQVREVLRFWAQCRVVEAPVRDTAAELIGLLEG